MRFARRHTRLVVTAVVVVATGLVGVGVAKAVGGSSPHKTPGSYGALPSYLPRSTLVPDSILIGSTRRPALTSEGDAVRVLLAHRSVLVTVSGPEVPGEGLPYQSTADTATWIVQMAQATGPVPISLRAFSAVDSLGKVYHLAFVPGQRRPPAVIRPGQVLHFELRVVLAVGEGMMRWAPVHNDLLATWDFVVEND